MFSLLLHGLILNFTFVIFCYLYKTFRFFTCKNCNPAHLLLPASWSESKYTYVYSPPIILFKFQNNPTYLVILLFVVNFLLFFKKKDSLLHSYSGLLLYWNSRVASTYGLCTAYCAKKLQHYCIKRVFVIHILSFCLHSHYENAGVAFVPEARIGTFLRFGKFNFSIGNLRKKIVSNCPIYITQRTTYYLR